MKFIFQPGDVVPFNMLYFGALEGGVAGVEVKAKAPFYIVSFKNQRMAFSYDGKTLSPYGFRFINAVTPNNEGAGGKANWMMYLGEARSPDAELEKRINAGQVDEE